MSINHSDTALNDAFTSSKVPKRIGYSVFLVTFCLFGFWASFAPLESAAIAQGVVAVENQRQVIQHYEGGRVKTIFVREGDYVSKDDLLLKLDDTQFTTDLEITRGQFISRKGLQSRLVAERDSSALITYPRDFEISDPRVLTTISNENQLFAARKRAFDGEVSILQQKIRLYDQQINGLIAVNSSKRKLLDSYISELNDLKVLLERGFVDQHRIKITERNIAETESEIAENDSMIASAKIQRGEASLQIIQLEQDRFTSIVDQIGQVQTEIFDLERRIDLLVDRVKRTAIISPASGYVINMSVNTLESVIQPGVNILEIVPQEHNIIVEARVSTTDVDKIGINNLADIRFSNFKTSTTPVVQGRVIHISADRLFDESYGYYFLTHLRLTEEGVSMLARQNLDVAVGMSVDVFINTGERTMLQYLLQPLTDAFAKSFKEY